MRTVAALALVALVALVPNIPVAAADDCGGLTCVTVSTNSVPDVPPQAQATYYVYLTSINCPAGTHCFVAGIVYQESNHLGGLQRTKTFGYAPDTELAA